MSFTLSRPNLILGDVLIDPESKDEVSTMSVLCDCEVIGLYFHDDNLLQSKTFSNVLAESYRYYIDAVRSAQIAQKLVILSIPQGDLMQQKKLPFPILLDKSKVDKIREKYSIYGLLLPELFFIDGSGAPLAFDGQIEKFKDLNEAIKYFSDVSISSFRKNTLLAKCNPYIDDDKIYMGNDMIKSCDTHTGNYLIIKSASRRSGVMVVENTSEEDNFESKIVAPPSHWALLSENTMRHLEISDGDTIMVKDGSDIAKASTIHVRLTCGEMIKVGTPIHKAIMEYFGVVDEVCSLFLYYSKLFFICILHLCYYFHRKLWSSIKF